MDRDPKLGVSWRCGNGVIKNSGFQIGEASCGDSCGELVYRAADDRALLPA
jgi:hypothetical protein